MSAGERILAWGVCLAFASLGLAYALILPPYEGFDEPEHYSYFSVLADRGEIPDFRTTPIDAAVARDAGDLPRPYGGVPPYESNGGRTYARFFGDVPAEQRREAVERFWHMPAAPAEYRPGTGLNWEGQHPPLYYAVMTLPYRLTRSWAPGARLVALRLASLLVACGSLFFWCRSLQVPESPAARRTLLLSGVAVLFFPSCWYDLGRMGSDSLAALLSAAAFYFLLCIDRHRQERLRDFLGLGIALGCGLVTKAFFLPLSVGAGVSLLWLGLARHRMPLPRLAVRWAMVAVAVLIAAPWFLLCFQRYGTMLVSAETYSWYARAAVRPGDSLSAFQYGAALLRAMAAFGATLAWCGSWSWVHRPLWHYALMFPLLLLTIAGLLRCCGRAADSGTKRLVLLTGLLLAPMFCSFLYYMHLKICFVGYGSGLGHYLFAAWPPVAVFLGHALVWRHSRWAKACLALALAAAVCFELSGVWFSAQVYAGIIQKLGAVKTGVGGLLPWPENVLLVYRRLQELAFPGCAAALFAASLVARVFIIGILFSLPVSAGQGSQTNDA